MNIPLIGHETGQYQVYPDYREIDKYTGVLKAWNLEVFQHRLKQAGMGSMDSIFIRLQGHGRLFAIKPRWKHHYAQKEWVASSCLTYRTFPGRALLW